MNKSDGEVVTGKFTGKDDQGCGYVIQEEPPEYFKMDNGLYAVRILPESWISVDGELPSDRCDDDDCIDVYSRSRGRVIDCSFIDRNQWETYHGDTIDDVTHWMIPTPAPVEQKKELNNA
jgi:hypothetical protein